MSDRMADPAGYDAVSEAKTSALVRLLRTTQGPRIERILVVGCGEGYEAGILARSFGAATIGIDICLDFSFDHACAAPAELRIMDARRLDFPDASFDLVYSFHALEHIPEPRRALAEMARVLGPGGTYLIGTPNRDRLVGYVGSAIPLRTKIHWNLADLSKRLRGRWSNEQGAHAGFAEAELRGLCAEAFGNTPRAIAEAYYREIYPRRLVEAIIRLGAQRFAFPCVYVTGQKAGAMAAAAA